MPGTLYYFGLKIKQTNASSITISADEKLDAIMPYNISRNRRRKIGDLMSSIELKAFLSINRSLRFIGMSEYPLASFCCSYLQQGPRTVEKLLKQTSMLKTVRLQSFFIIQNSTWKQ